MSKHSAETPQWRDPGTGMGRGTDILLRASNVPHIHTLDESVGRSARQRPMNEERGLFFDTI